MKKEIYILNNALKKMNLIGFMVMASNIDSKIKELAKEIIKISSEEGLEWITSDFYSMFERYHEDIAALHKLKEEAMDEPELRDSIYFDKLFQLSEKLEQEISECLNEIIDILHDTVDVSDLVQKLASFLDIDLPNDLLSIEELPSVRLINLIRNSKSQNTFSNREFDISVIDSLNREIN